MIFDRYVRLDIGLKFFSKLQSKPDFLSKGLIIACIISAGKTPDSRDRFTISVMQAAEHPSAPLAAKLGPDPASKILMQTSR